jgi:hypothetical protein
MTFKLILPDGKPINLKQHFPNAILIHKKGTAIYTINALNKLIESISGAEVGNTDYKSVKINWDEYQDKMILLNGKDLAIYNIERIF